MGSYLPRMFPERLKSLYIAKKEGVSFIAEPNVAAFANDTTKIYGFQYHPEVVHTLFSSRPYLDW